MKKILVVAPLSAVVGFMLALALISQPPHTPNHRKSNSTQASAKIETEVEPVCVPVLVPEKAEEPAIRVGSRSVSWSDLVARIRDVESVYKEQPHLADSVDYKINCSLLELEAERLGVALTEPIIRMEVERQVEGLKRQVIEKYGGAVIWVEWLKQQNLDQDRLNTYLSKAARIILLKRILVNASETRCNSRQLKDQLGEFLAFADVDDRRFKRWVEEVKKTGRYPIELNPALKGE